MRSPALTRTGQSDPISIVTFLLVLLERLATSSDSSNDDELSSMPVLSAPVVISYSVNAMRLLGLSLRDLHDVYQFSFHSSGSGILVTVN